ncbi:hypothetical protein [Methylobacter sp.]|uniref:hypothetical protein n=1 Tax=Methylobacter sp. TaxID=2051955 RepID=UPI003DA252B7
MKDNPLFIEAYQCFELFYKQLEEDYKKDVVKDPLSKSWIENGVKEMWHEHKALRGSDISKLEKKKIIRISALKCFREEMYSRIYGIESAIHSLDLRIMRGK